MWLVMRAPFFADWFFGDLNQNFLPLFQQIADQRHWR